MLMLSFTYGVNFLLFLNEKFRLSLLRRIRIVCPALTKIWLFLDPPLKKFLTPPLHFCYERKSEGCRYGPNPSNLSLVIFTLCPIIRRFQGIISASFWPIKTSSRCSRILTQGRCFIPFPRKSVTSKNLNISRNTSDHVQTLPVYDWLIYSSARHNYKVIHSIKQQDVLTVFLVHFLPITRGL